MLRTRKRWISLLVTLAMLVAFCLPAGTAFAAGNYSYYASCPNLDKAENQALGYVIIDDLAYKYVDKLYVNVEILGDLEFSTNSVVYHAYKYGAAQEKIDVNCEGKDSFKVEIPITEDWDDTGYIKIDGLTANLKKFDGVVKLAIELVAVDGSDNEVWSDKFEVPVGKTADYEITVTADKPTTIKPATFGAKLAKITIKENEPGALKNGNVIRISLPSDDFAWNMDEIAENIEGNWGLTAAVYGAGDTNKPEGIEIDDEEIVLVITGESSTRPDKLEITGYVDVMPGVKGELEVSVTCNNEHFEDADLVVAYVGASDVDIEVDLDDADDLYPASQEKTIGTITLESSGTFAEGDDIFVELPEGVKWATSIDEDDNIGDVKVVKKYLDDRALWLEVYEDGVDEIELEDLKVDVMPDAEIGDVEAAFSGAVEGTAKVAEVKARFTVSAEKPNVVVALDQAAGDIKIVEAAKNSVATKAYDNEDSTLVLELPKGVYFAGKPTVEVNGDEIDDDDVGLNDDDDVCTINIGSYLRSTKVDEIVISDIEYDLDERVAYGDIEVDIGGTAVNGLDPDDYDDEYDDAVASVANATVVSPTAGKATMKIGDPTIVINGETKTMEAAPYIKNSRTYVSVTYAALACGVAPENIMWDGVNRTVTVIKGDRIAQFKIGSNVMTLNGAVITMDTAPEIVNARTMMPVTWVALALGGNTAWDAATQTVTVTVN
ncbi:MAG: hypothetical protein PWQ39_951 [Thermacetogenium sp.]|nr:hypothetical protein [Thermacetogenium sp.]